VTIGRNSIFRASFCDPNLVTAPVPVACKIKGQSLADTPAVIAGVTRSPISNRGSARARAHITGFYPRRLYRRDDHCPLIMFGVAWVLVMDGWSHPIFVIRNSGGGRREKNLRGSLRHTSRKFDPANKRIDPIFSILRSEKLTIVFNSAQTKRLYSSLINVGSSLAHRE